MTVIRDEPRTAVGTVPFCVDLDRTLAATDSLYEGIIALVRRNPLHALALPFWALRGRGHLTREIAARAPLDAASLPYHPGLLSLIASMHGRRPVVLCTAAHHDNAMAVAAHLGLFDRVMATQDANFSAGRKAAALVAEFGEGGFDYAGSRTSDIEVFAVARHAIVVNPTAGLQRRLSEVSNLEQVVDGRPPQSFRTVLQAMRLHQWVKNILVFVALIAAHRVGDVDALWRTIEAFVAYGLCASSVYLLNDLLDLREDRAHPRKRHRPLASGALSIRAGLVLMPSLLIAAFALALSVSQGFAELLALYYVTTNLYAFWLKRVPILDTLVLAGLYTLRILAGAAAIPVVPSFWLLAFSMFFFFSLALAKRLSELFELEDANEEGDGLSGHFATSTRPSGWSAIPGRGYDKQDHVTIISQGTAAGQAAVLVLALYINSDAVRAQFSHPEVLWLICPLMVYWITKFWLNAQRRQITEDPVVWAVKNRVSRTIGVLCLMLFALAV